MDRHDQLMSNLAHGDQSAFAAIAAEFGGSLIGWFTRRTRDSHAAEDLAQETLLRVYAKAGKYRPEGQFSGWLWCIARRLLIDSHRHGKHDPLNHSVSRTADDESDVLSLIAGKSASPCEDAETREAIQLVMDAMDELSDGDDHATAQCVTLLDYVAGDSLPEIAERYSIPLPTAKGRSRIAKEKLSRECRATLAVRTFGERLLAVL